MAKNSTSGKKEFDHSLTAIGNEDADGPVKLVIFMRVIGPRMNDVVDGIVFWMVRTKQILVWLQRSWMPFVNGAVVSMSQEIGFSQSE